MKKEKSFIKTILSNWYMLNTSINLDIIDLLIPLEQALKKLESNGELRSIDLLILSAFKDGYKYEEIAKIVKMSRQTVSNRIDSIVSRLETLLGDDYVS
jgi:DNA-binding NarL/FixJ family response regulator